MSKYPIENGVMTYPDGREECVTSTAAGQRAYDERTMQLASRQYNLCAICRFPMFFPTFDHQAGRGMSRSHIDERLTFPDGTWMNAALCGPCNGMKGSKRFHWVGTQYVPVEQYSRVS